MPQRAKIRSILTSRLPAGSGKTAVLVDRKNPDDLAALFESQPPPRLHLNDGPIDLILQADGAPPEIQKAYEAAVIRFDTILDELCAELPLLRAQQKENSPRPGGVIARRMAEAVSPFASKTFITPMAAVAGAVAEEILFTMTSAADLTRAYVNNGGDIALHLSPGTSYKVGMINRPDQPSLFGSAAISHASDVRGIATSGWCGRSLSLGIADAVTVLAVSASAADAAATIIANAVNLPDHPGITRVPANEIALDSDLGAILVTRGVPHLDAAEIRKAVAAGADVARELLHRELILAAALHLQGHTELIAAPALTFSASQSVASSQESPA